METPLRTTRQDAGFSFDALPTEIINHICCFLCLHCQIDIVVDATSAVVVPAFQDQLVLARLSQCSKRLRGIAQPVLFHWYHGLEKEDYHIQFNRLAAFVRATIQAPRLAKSVRALAFYKYGDNAGLTISPTGVNRQDPGGLFQAAAAKLGGYLQDKWTRFIPTIDSLQELAMATLLSITQLCLQRTFVETPEKNWVHWSYDMSSLTYLAFVGNRHGLWCETTYHIQEAKALLRHAPNLRTLVAAECTGGQTSILQKFRRTPWDIALLSLRKLSIDGYLDNPAIIVRSCPSLEDLEILHDYDPFQRPINEERDLNHLRGTLRRLCCSATAHKGLGAAGRSGESARNEILRLVEFCHPAGENALKPSFVAFAVLEELEMDQSLLYGAVFSAGLDWDHPEAEDRSLRVTTPEDLLSRLPPSLQRLRVGCIICWPVLYRDLLALAHQRESQFPVLETVVIEVFVAPPEEEHQNLVDTLRSVAGVTVSICYVARSLVSRGLLSLGPGHAPVVPKPVVYS
ncbi:hypothetical protein N0V88_006996 [Collariella sp. IMI 366227]|nr:hypothetical protein N0V88_006996 [Collariella sp. IMI 366227]